MEIDSMMLDGVSVGAERQLAALLVRCAENLEKV
jgi:hypothetical protein